MPKAKETTKTKKTPDPTLETSLNSDLKELGFKNITGEMEDSKE